MLLKILLIAQTQTTNTPPPPQGLLLVVEHWQVDWLCCDTQIG